MATWCYWMDSAAALRWKVKARAQSILFLEPIVGSDATSSFVLRFGVVKLVFRIPCAVAQHALSLYQDVLYLSCLQEAYSHQGCLV